MADRRPDEGDLRSYRLFTPPVIALLAIGVVLRLWLLTHRPYFWLDETHLVPNVVDRDWAMLFTPAINDQMAPFGFLAAAKLSAVLFGPYELPLRLPGFVAGIACLALLPPFCRSVGLSRPATVVAVAIGALLPPWIYYSAEFKQYSIEMALAMAATIATARGLDDHRPSARLPLAAVGVVSAGFALSAPLFLGALGGYLLIEDLRARRWRLLVATAAMAAVWLALFVVHYELLKDAGTVSRMSGRFWLGAMAPFSPAVVAWAIERQYALFEFLTTSTFTGGGIALVALIGACVLAWRRDRRALWLSVLPLAAAFAAACAHVYPYDSRLLLFATPGIVVLIACGVEALHDAVRTGGARFALAVAATLLFGQLTIEGLAQAARWHDDPIPAAIAYTAAHRRDGDVVYVHALALPQWRYYARRYPGLSAHRGPIVYGRDGRHGIAYLMQDLQTLFGQRRVWIVMARGPGVSFLRDGTRDQTLIDYVAGVRGVVRARFRREGSEALLVDFSRAGARDIAPATLPPYVPPHASYRPTAD